MKTLLTHVAAASLLAFSCGCAQLGQQFGQGQNGQGGFDSFGAGIAGSLLGSTGLVSGSQAEAVFKAGSKLAQASRGLTDEQEYFLGRGVSAMVFGEYRPLSRAQLNLYVNKVGLSLASYSERPETFGGYHFMVLDTPEVNALSAPSGFVFVTKGLLALMPNEDALAAVLAHEIGHVVKGHGVDAIKKANLTDALTIIGKEAASTAASRSFGGGIGGAVSGELVNAFGDSIGDVFSTLIKKGYSRSQEYDADEYAVELMKKAGYNPSGLGDMLKALQAVENTQKGGWFETHPSPEDRIRHVSDSITTAAAAEKGAKVRTARFQQVVKGLS